MGDVLFYHLTRSSVERALGTLLDKALAAGWRVVVRGTDDAHLQRLDERLWLGPEERFLPHGLACGPHDAHQPVLLTTDSAIPNGAACLMSLDGAEVSAQEARELTRICILFDGGDEDALERARTQWKALREAGIEAQYWSEASGRWQKERG